MTKTNIDNIILESNGNVLFSDEPYQEPESTEPVIKSISSDQVIWAARYNGDYDKGNSDTVLLQQLEDIFWSVAGNKYGSRKDPSIKLPRNWIKNFLQDNDDKRIWIINQLKDKFVEYKIDRKHWPKELKL